MILNEFFNLPQVFEKDMDEGYSLGKVLSLPELLDQIKHILTAKHPGIGWRMTMPAENTFLFSAQNDYDVWSMLVVEPGGDDWVAVGHGMVDPDGKPIIFDRQQLPMTLASASEIADEAIQTYHDIDLSDYADDEDYNQGVAEGEVVPFKQKNPLTPNLVKQLKALSQQALELFWEGSYMPTAAQGQVAQLGKNEEQRMFKQNEAAFRALGYEYSIIEDSQDLLSLHSLAREAWYEADKPANQYRGLPDLQYNAETNTLSYYDLIGADGYEYNDNTQFEGVAEGFFGSKKPTEEYDIYLKGGYDPHSVKKYLLGKFGSRGWRVSSDSMGNGVQVNIDASLYPSELEAKVDLRNAKQGVAEGEPGDLEHELERQDHQRRQRRDQEAEYGADWDAMVSRVGQKAKAGPLKTVYDPERRVYRNVPVNENRRALLKKILES